MKRILLMLTLLLMAVTPSFADKKKKLNEDTQHFRYDIEYCRNSEGFLLVKVWSYSKKSHLALAQARKNAIHGVIFRGYAATDGEYASISPLVKDPSVVSMHADFFNAFFDDEVGSYMRYAPSVLDSSTTVVKVGKEYKVGVVVTVNHKLLRQHLEEAGIIKPFGAGLF